ncbi:CAAX prenyl protease 2 [Lepeophtheirus salmonis]|uniref:CAAX prenyl protease 2 n=1 Tax=Lepeophtheirus salmonis TaxID=72036 RepID=A0A0K2UQB6_LEPSM|nr:CAAX prenyl protease 2-like [Lepeophtheirus salmonis]
MSPEPTIWSSGIPAFALGCIYVLSLYVWRSDIKDRNHPNIIKRRFISAFLTTLVAPWFVYAFGHVPLLEKHGLLNVLGIRFSGFIPALIIPLFLSLILFLGPFVSLVLSIQGDFVSNFLQYLSAELRSWIWWRNHIVAPFTEEFTYRACMIPILIGYFGPKASILVSPLLFGIAHFHHMVEKINQGQDFMSAFFISGLQFSYTTVFGTFSAYLFLMTGHLVAPVVVHGFCNFMGFPDLVEFCHLEGLRRHILLGIYVLGVILFCSLIGPLTDTGLYENKIYSLH